jgi:hypothetical protein
MAVCWGENGVKELMLFINDGNTVNSTWYQIDNDAIDRLR